MSDKETAPWIKAAAKEIFDMIGSTSLAWYQTQAAEIIAKHAVECTAPAPQPAINRFELIDWTANGRFGCGRVTTIWEKPEEISIRYQLQDGGRTLKVFVSDGAAATPQVTPKCINPHPHEIGRGCIFPQVTPMCIHCRVKPRRPFTDCCSDECELAREGTSEQATPELELEQEADGRWIAAYTRFPGVAAYGPSKEEAIRNAAKVLIEDGEVERG